MRTVNSVTLLGNVIRTPEKRVTSGGKSFATLVIATQKDSPRHSDRQSSSEFHNVIAWGSLGGIAENFCKKGKTVYIEGYLKTRSWQHENGSKVFRTEIVATNIISIAGSDYRQENKNSQKFLEIPSDEEFFSVTPDDFFKD